MLANENTELETGDARQARPGPDIAIWNSIETGGQKGEGELRLIYPLPRSLASVSERTESEGDRKELM